MIVASAPVVVIPHDYPELSLLVWNRDPRQAIPAAEAFEIYENNWRHVDRDRLVPHEAALIAALTAEFGQGNFLAAE